MYILDTTSQGVGIGRTKRALERHVFVRGRDQRASERERERENCYGVAPYRMGQRDAVCEEGVGQRMEGEVKKEEDGGG
jgi:uncharacterized membrane protein